MRAKAIVVLPDELVQATAERAVQLMAQKPETRWLDAAAAAAHLCCHRNRIYKLASARRIPYEREGGRLLFDKQALDAWVRAGGRS